MVVLIDRRLAEHQGRRPTMAKTYAMLETKSADLATEFGLDWATKLFGAEAIASLPVRTSGKNKGKPKGAPVRRFL
jgi:hypothetical protein